MRIKMIFQLMSIMALFALLLPGCGGNGNSTEDTEFEFTPSVFTLSIISSPAEVTDLRYAEVQFDTSEVANTECSLDQAEFFSCESPYFINNLSTGVHHLSIRATAHSNQTTDSIEVVWVVEPIEPFTHSDLIATQVHPDPLQEEGWRGIFRVNCDFAHALYDDPIVFPGQANAAHLHRFYGNTLTDHASTEKSLYLTGESTCQGNLLNLSAYWVPALLAPVYNELTGEPEVDEQGETLWQYVRAVVGNDDEAHEIFYYSAGVDDLSSIQPIPPGLRMIAGDMTTMPPDEQSASVVRWHCQSWESNDANNPQFSASIPECFAPDRLRMDIFFPSCWNGVDLDSDDHKSHMAYPIQTGGPNGSVCPDSHPVPLVRPSFHYAFGVKPEVYNPQTRSTNDWRLASDHYEVTETQAGGLSLHGDWINAWHPEIMETLLQNCIQNALDCHDGNLANGYRLSGTREGSLHEAEIINGGMSSSD